MAGMTQEGETLEFADHAVPPDARMARLPLTMAWWSVCSAMFYLFVAASLALAYGSMNAIIGVVLSVICYAAINAVLVRYSIRTGLSVSLFSRVLLGRNGAAIATLIFFATAIYYAVFEGSVIALALAETFDGLTYPIAALVVVIYSVLLIFGSIQNWLDKFNGVLLPFYILGLAAAVILAVAKYGYSNAWLELGPEGGAPAGGWWDCFVAYMGVWILMMYTFDYARFGKIEDAGYHATINFGAPFYLVTFLLNALVGIFLAASLPTEGGISEVSVVFALLELMGFAGLAFVWISQTRINTANYYLASVNMESFAETVIGLKLPKIVWACVVGAVVYVLMLADVFSYILQALAYQGIFVVAWVAIALTHIFSGTYERVVGANVICDRDHVPVINRGGLAAWFGASAVGLVLHQIGGAAGSWSAPATFIVATAIYMLSLRSATRERFVIAA